MKPVIMDAGPLIAWFCIRDSHHDWAATVFDQLPSGALVCEAVLTEACHLVAKDGISPASVLKLVERNDLVLVSLAGETSAIRSLMESYADTPMDFADACLVRLAELHEDARVPESELRAAAGNGAKIRPFPGHGDQARWRSDPGVSASAGSGLTVRRRNYSGGAKRIRTVPKSSERSPGTRKRESMR